MASQPWRQGRSSSNEWVIAIKSDLKRRMKQSEQSAARMFRVPDVLRKVKSEHFTPDFISLGLFNAPKVDVLGRVQMKGSKTSSDHWKLTMAIAFLRSTNLTEDDWEDVCEQVVGNPAKMKELYDMEAHEHESGEVIQSVLTLDAVFLTGFLIGAGALAEYSHEWPLFCEIFHGMSRNNITTIRKDIIKVENQIPLRLLRNVLVILIKNQNSLESSSHVIEQRADKLLGRLCNFLVSICSFHLSGRIPNLWTKFVDEAESLRCDHLLGCLYYAMVDGKVDSEICKYDEELDNLYGALPSVTKLRDAGIKFEGQAIGISKAKFVPRFFKATLYLPTLRLSDLTVFVWRNLLAHEALVAEGTTRFGSFLKLLDELIDTKEDVWLLRHGQNPVVVQNCIGDKADAVTLFNSVAPSAAAWFNEDHLQLRKDILKFYHQKYRRTWVEFLRDNFGKPWIALSVLAAVILLIATILQTVYTMLGYYFYS